MDSKYIPKWSMIVVSKISLVPFLDVPEQIWKGLKVKPVASPDVDDYKRKKGPDYPSALGWYNH